MAAKKRDYKKEYANYHGKPKQIKRRDERNTARAKLKKAGKVKVGDGKEVHHKDHNTANNSSKNLSVTTRTYNRSRNKKKK